MIILSNYEVGNEVDFYANYVVTGEVTAVTETHITIDRGEAGIETYTADMLVEKGSELPRPEDNNIVYQLASGQIIDAPKATLSVLLDSGELETLYVMTEGELTAVTALINA